MHKLEGGVHAHRLEHQMREWEGSSGEEGLGLDTDGTLRRCPEGAERRSRRGGNRSSGRGQSPEAELVTSGIQQLCDLGRVFHSSLVFLMRGGVTGL